MTIFRHNALDVRLRREHADATARDGVLPDLPILTSSEPPASNVSEKK